MESRLVTDKDEGMVEAILKLESLFPQKIGYGEWDVWDNLQNINNINIVIEEDGRIVGYMLAIPQAEAVGYLKEEDPLITNKDGMYHADQGVVVEDKRNGIIFRRLIGEIMIEVRKRGGNSLSSYMLAGGLSTAVEKFFEGHILGKRTARLPSYGDHDLTYIEVEIF